MFSFYHQNVLEMSSNESKRTIVQPRTIHYSRIIPVGPKLVFLQEKFLRFLQNVVSGKWFFHPQLER